MKIVASLSALFAFFMALWTGEPQQPEPQQQVQIVSITKNDYDEMWKKIESLEQKGMIKDALKLAEEILTKAKAESNGNQQVKAILHIMKYKQVVEENSDSLQMLFIQKEIETAKMPTQNILQSIKATMYWQYYSSHRWEIMNRTKVTGEGAKNLDYKTWDTQTFMENIQAAFLASLTPVADLQKENINNYLDILNHDKENESAKYRPTLYDILAHRAMDFFQSTEYDVTRPADAFALNIAQGFAPAADFVAFKFDEKDNLSRDLRTAQIFQNLLSFHLKNNNLLALMEADLARLAWAKERVVANAGANKEEAYLAALEKLAKQHEGNEIVAEVNALIALHFQGKGNSYNANEGEAHRFDKVKAMQMCDAMIQKYPNARGTGRCKDIKNQILTKSIAVKVEDVNVPNKPIRAYLSYQNLNKVYFRVIAASKELEKKLEGKYGNDRAKVFAGETALKAWDNNMPNLEKDYQTHGLEAKVPELVAGKYYLLASDNPQFSSEKGALSHTYFQVASIAFYQFRKNNYTDVFFTDRESGQPLADLEVTEYIYNYQKGKEEKGKASRTNNEGKIRVFSPERTSYNMYFEVKRGSEIYTTPSVYSYNYGENPVQIQTETHLFTDRQIYRPGQTVYFKAILLQREGEKVKILANHKTTIAFKDANYQEVAKLELTTNQYGTVSGTFTAPTSGLTGDMTLEGENGSASFNVEEYKRPKFEVTFDELKGAFELNDKVTTKGKAMGFAGNAIDGATVKYRIVRNVNYPYWYCYRWWMPTPYSPEVEIGNGTTKTEIDGSFSIDFTALPDATLSKDDKPEFSYTVYADVVDITGETHSASQYVSVGYISLRASLGIPSELTTAKIEKDSLTITTNNLNGTFEAAKGKLTIHRLTSPTQTFRNRRWEKSDAALFTEEEYHKLFPNDVWKEENDYRTWKKESLVWDLDFDTEVAKKYSLAKLKGAKVGKYVAELLTKDKSGNEIKVLQYFEVKEENANMPAIPTVLATSLNKEAFEPNETAELSLLTSEAILYVNYQILMGDNILESKIVQLKKGERKTISLPIKEEHRGGLNVMVATICHNEFLSSNHNISVPWTNKQLKLEWMTFRNKVLPGAKEEWRVKISGPKGEKVAAEMLATMYDASLDEFRANYFEFNVHPYRYSNYYWDAGQHFSYSTGSVIEQDWNKYEPQYKYINFDRLNEFGFYFGEGGYYGNYGGSPRKYKLQESMNISMSMDGAAPPPPAAAPIMTKMAAKDHSGEERDEAKVADSVAKLVDEKPAEKERQKGKDKEGGKKEVQVRRNLQETAFFFPTLMTNEAGEVIFSFTMPEALTKWKFLGLAHTQELQIGQLNDFTVTQKELMVMPNTPRFLREGDKLALGCKVVNLSDKSRAGVIELKLSDALTGKDLTQDFKNYNWQQKFFVEKGQSQAITWDIEIPESAQAVLYQMVAESENVGDGEENMLPVVPNRMMVTESIPLWVHAGKSKTFNFNNLLNSANSTTLKHQNFSLEFTSNPAWYAVQSLPYLMEYPHECTEQLFSRYYANSLASHLANSSPKIKQVFDQWRNTPIGGNGKQALLSNLETNQELKSALLEETPWVLEAKDETQRKQRLAVLFDLNKMASEQEKAEKMLVERQNDNGSFTWFPGMQDNRYITQLIATGVGHLKKMDVAISESLYQAMDKAVPYLDKQMRKDYEELKRYKADMSKDNLGYDQIQYLYMRSFYEMKNGEKEYYDYYFNQAKKYWNNKSMYMKGMIAIILHRGKEDKIAKEIIESLRQNAVHNEEMGMYWKQNAGFYWFEAPIEMQALMIEAFDEVAKDEQSVEEMKIWLLKNKQTNDWKTTRATVEACNALLMTGTEMLSNSELVQIVIGGKAINPNERPDAKVEAGTGYFKTSWAGAEVNSSFGKIEVKNPNKSGTSWGGVYWQYFEQLDKIQYAATPLAIQKQLFIETPSATGPVLTPITNNSSIKQGDKVIVRVEIRVDRPMEYVHLKDMRAAGFEPINVLSQYKYQGGLGYYEATKDLATHFFIDYLPKGTFVFEYPLRATHKGDFSNGITTMQCMYAPEFTTHSKGIRVQIK